MLSTRSLSWTLRGVVQHALDLSAYQLKLVAAQAGTSHEQICQILDYVGPVTLY